MQMQNLDVYEEFFLNLPENMVSPLTDSLLEDALMYQTEMNDPEM